MPSRVVANGRVLVRCLGPGRAEHSFISDGPDNRICSRCRAELDRLTRSVSPRMLTTTAAVDTRDSRGRLRT